MITLVARFAVLLALLLPAPALAQRVTAAEVPHTEQTFGSIVIRSPWTRATPPGQKVSAFYMVIENTGSEPVSIVSATTPIAPRVELHDMKLVDGYIKMGKVERIEIPAGGTVELKPSNYHLMAIGLTRMVRIGRAYDVTLNFSNGTSATVPAVAWDVGTVKAD